MTNGTHDTPAAVRVILTVRHGHNLSMRRLSDPSDSPEKCPLVVFYEGNNDASVAVRRVVSGSSRNGDRSRLVGAHRGRRPRLRVRSSSPYASGRAAGRPVSGPGTGVPSPGMKMAPHVTVERHLRRLTSYQASPRLVVTGSATLVGNPDDVPPAAYSGEWVPGSTRGAPTGVNGVSLPLRLWPGGGP